MQPLLACALAYLLGGVPFALLLVRAFKGVDVRAIGSGNVGATNASRAFTGRARRVVFVLVYMLDFAKGFVPAWFFPRWLDLHALGASAAVAAGACAIVGHVASPYLRFKGGKGVATTCGVIAALDWVVLAGAVGVFLVVLLATRRVFLGSLALGFALPIVALARADSLPVVVFCAAAALLFCFTHRTNIKKALAARAAGASA